MDAHPGSQPLGEKLCSSWASGFSTARAGKAVGCCSLLLWPRWEGPPPPPTPFNQPFADPQRLQTRRTGTQPSEVGGAPPTALGVGRGSRVGVHSVTPVPFTRVPGWGSEGRR